MAKIVFAIKVLLMAAGLHQLLSYVTNGRKGSNTENVPWLAWNEVDTVPVGRLNWCNNTEGVDTLMCNFQNLCYSAFTKNFNIFYHGTKPKGELDVVPHYHVVPLTTAVGVYYWFYYFELPYRFLRDDQRFIYRYYSKGKYRILSKITASNTAHDIHDVLLPVFQTFTPAEVQEGPSRTLVGLFHDTPLAESEPLFRLFSKNYPILDSDFDMEPRESLFCFEDVTIGLPRSKLWYQWGLNRMPESPLTNLNVTAGHVRNFTSYIIDKLNIDIRCNSRRKYGVLFSRKSNRKLINGEKLSAAVSDKFNIPVVEISLERTPMNKIIETLSCANLAMGVHGAMLIFGMFLPRYSVLLEIFPYAINPAHHTPYKTMVSLPGMGIDYIAWRNKNKSASVMSEKTEAKFGIGMLGEDEQREILNRTEVPQKLCCNDPEWKYRLYHDTIVDIPSVLKALENSIYLKKLSRN